MQPIPIGITIVEISRPSRDGLAFGFDARLKGQPQRGQLLARLETDVRHSGHVTNDMWLSYGSPTHTGPGLKRRSQGRNAPAAAWLRAGFAKTGAYTGRVADYAGTRPVQQDRAAETREQILKAAVASLIERGYAKLTTSEVAKRAGVSRGAQTYHFKTKQQLVLATVEHVFELRSEQFRTAIRKLPQEDRYTSAIDLLWEIISGDTFHAWLEVTVAARTDPELRVAVSELTDRMVTKMETNFGETFPELEAVPEYRVIPDMVMAMIEGMAVGAIVKDDPERRRRMLDTMKLIGSLLGPLKEMVQNCPFSAGDETSD